ncbi:MAG: RHS repeat-associated core domain-containing protein, partial [Granulosicoccaceae bacterium]
GLVYAQQRFYDPLIGRFLSVDSAPARLHQPETLNRYTYARNNPYKYTDPNGQNGILYLAGLMSESIEGITGRGDGTFDGHLALGALYDGYNGEGAGFAQAAVDDVLAIMDVASVGYASRAKAVSAVSTQAARSVAATAKELNQIAHVFPRAEKGLEGLVRASSGSELSALRAVQSTANKALSEGLLVAGNNGVLPGKGLGIVLEVNGVNVQLIGGRVVNGVVELGSFVGL